MRTLNDMKNHLNQTRKKHHRHLTFELVSFITCLEKTIRNHSTCNVVITSATRTWNTRKPTTVTARVSWRGEGGGRGGGGGAWACLVSDGGDVALEAHDGAQRLQRAPQRVHVHRHPADHVGALHLHSHARALPRARLVHLPGG